MLLDDVEQLVEPVLGGRAQSTPETKERSAFLKSKRVGSYWYDGARFHATANPLLLCRLAAAITPTTSIAASAVIFGRGGQILPLIFLAAVMPLVPLRWQPRDNTESFMAQ